MKQILFIIAISIIINGCVSSSKLTVSNEHLGTQDTCEFDSIKEPIYRLSGNSIDIKLFVRSRSDKYKFESFISERNTYTLTGKMVKIISFKQDTSIAGLLDSLKLFPAKGKKYVYADGFYKGITEDCDIVYFESKYLFEDYSGILTTQDYQPLDGDNKIELTKHFENLISGLKISVTQDEFEGDKWLKTPVIDNTFLRALIDLNTNQLRFIQIYSTTEHYSDWAHLDSAKDRRQKSFELVQVDKDVDCSGAVGCIMYESVGINIPIDYLVNHPDGIEIQASGRKGKSLIYVPSNSVKLMLEALENHSTI